VNDGKKERGEDPKGVRLFPKAGVSSVEPQELQEGNGEKKQWKKIESWISQKKGGYGEPPTKENEFLGGQIFGEIRKRWGP